MFKTKMIIINCFPLLILEVKEKKYVYMEILHTVVMYWSTQKASQHGQKCSTFVYRRRHFHFASLHPPIHNTVYIEFSKGTEISNNILKSNKNESKVHHGNTHLREATQTGSCSTGYFPCVFSLCECGRGRVACVCVSVC